MDRTGDTRSRTTATLALVVGLFATVATYALFVRTAGGQRLDADLVSDHGWSAAVRLLAAYDRHVILVEFLVLTAVLVIAARRRRSVRGVLSAALPLAAVGAAAVAKFVLPRPDLIAAGTTHNSFPSGHVALAAATVLALCLVLPRAARLAVGLAGGVLVAVVTLATITAGWHRFSDGLGAVLIAVAGAGLVVLLSPIHEPISLRQSTAESPLVLDQH